MSYRLGLTGSIGMGKSTAARMFADLGHPVWDADAAVHRLYAPGGAAVAPVLTLFPDAEAPDGGIDRTVLAAALRADPSNYARLEHAVHPLLPADRAKFASEHSDAPILVFDIPLLFETGGEAQMDGVAVCSTDAETQRHRVLARKGMTAERFAEILARQLPDAEKRARADWIIQTDSIDTALDAVRRICDEILHAA
ncbi:dephospho-CoA kinase (plasmid) [Paracoccus sp. TK19116]|uniref:Dephospho-CoA kinase n=1 Tax=Paracoccus albicereus TaxID=2922394 RepID=A0ABT1MPK3_9RHOB|nr:dephospho-CoA kinase [Paracoccus albicereus]MCQ0969333.1 dephospho-CoA kinase [Paracoccus albicereus]